MGITQLNILSLSKTRIANLSLTLLKQAESAANHIAAIPLHKHNYTEVFLCTGGSLTVCTESMQIPLCCGDMLLIPPDILHHCLPAEREGDAASIFGVMAEQCTDEQDQDLFGQISPILTDGAIRLFQHAEALSPLVPRILSAPNSPHSACLTVKLLEFMMEAPCTVVANRSSEESSSMPDKDRQRIARLEMLINGGFNYNLTLSQAAAALYLSERQLARIVGKYYGMTLQKLVTHKRMETAANLLATTDESSEAIGLKVGFGAKSSFYRAFRMHFGMTPMEYRHAKRAEQSQS